MTGDTSAVLSAFLQVSYNVVLVIIDTSLSLYCLILDEELFFL